LLTINTHGQESDDDEALIGFFTVTGGVHSTQVNSTGELFDGDKSGIGYELGVYYYLTNEIEYDTFFFRVGLDYSQEKGESGNTILYQNIPVISKGNFKFLGLRLLGAYRFDPMSKINAYLGGGIFIQTRLNSTDDAFIFVTEDNEEFPVFTPDNSSAPIRYQGSGPDKIILGFTAEMGSFVHVGGRWLTIGLGINYGFFSKIFGAQKISKSNLYLKIGYELF